MGNTAYSPNFQIKLIGTGREAGTWGSSSNENFARIEAAIGATTSIAIDSMPSGSVNATVGNSWTATWVTVDTADNSSAQSGSEGRSAAVEVTSGTIAGTDPILNVRGSNAGESVSRLIYIKNSIADDKVLRINGNGASLVDIRNGNWALVALLPLDKGNLTAGAINVLNGLQVGSLSFDEDSSLAFVAGSNVIQIPDAEAAALTVTDGTDSFLSFDTVDNEVNILQNLSLVDKGNASLITLPDSVADTLDIQDESANSYIKISTDGSGSITLGRSLLLEDPSVISATTDIAWYLNDDSGTGLRFFAGPDQEVLRIVTLNTGESIIAQRVVEMPDLFLNGTDGYIAFETNEATPSDNYGIRNLAGVVQVRNDAETWAAPITHSMESGNGLFFESSANLGNAGSGLMADSFSQAQDHGMSTVPKMVRAVLRCIDTDQGYSVNDEISVDALNGGDGGGSVSSNADSISYGANANDVFVHVDQITLLWTCPSGGGQSDFLDRTKWDLYIYAWK